MMETPRSTPDLIVLVLSITVGVTVILLTLAAIIYQFTNPDQSPKEIFGVIVELVKVVTATIVGYLAGRSVPRD